jgi:hypothetical protein
MSPGYGGYQSTTLPCRLTIKDQLPLLQLTTLRLSSATPSRLQIITPQLMLPQATTLNARSICLPRATLPKGRELRLGSQVLHHQGTGVQKRSNTTQKRSWVNIFLFFMEMWINSILFLIANMLVFFNINVQIICLVQYGVVLLWMLQQWWLVRPLVWRLLLGVMGVNIPQQPVTTLRPSSATPPRLQNITP